MYFVSFVSDKEFQLRVNAMSSTPAELNTKLQRDNVSQITQLHTYSSTSSGAVLT